MVDRKLAVILVLLLAGGIALTLSAVVFGIFPFDLKVESGVKGVDDPVFAALMAAVSFPGDRGVPVVLVLGVAAVCAYKKRWLEAVFVIATLSSVVIAVVFKLLVGRSRPPGLTITQSDLFLSFNQYAYPSGHVLFFVVFFGFVGYLSWKYLGGWIRWIAISGCALLIVLIGPSRVYLGRHWVSDVIGSFFIGISWLIILILLYQMALHLMISRLEEGGAL
jgi:membrane-associated phospholipid phosphatase